MINIQSYLRATLYSNRNIFFSENILNEKGTRLQRGKKTKKNENREKKVTHETKLLSKYFPKFNPTSERENKEIYNFSIFFLP